MATHITWADCAVKVAVDDAGGNLSSGADSPLTFDAAFSPLAFDSNGGGVSSIDFTTQGAGSSQNSAVPGAAFAATSVAAIPEPHTNLLMLAGLAAIGFMATRRRRP
jgi:PEP-CTERM motif